MLTAAAILALSSGMAFAQTGKPMKITLNFLAAAPNAGFMMAKQMGLYEKAGINLTIEEGKGSGTTAQMVATGQTDVGFADAPAAMQLRTKGAPVKISSAVSSAVASTLAGVYAAAARTAACQAWVPAGRGATAELTGSP